MESTIDIPFVGGGPFDGFMQYLANDPIEQITIDPLLTLPTDALRSREGLPSLGTRTVAIYHLTHTPAGWRFAFHGMKIGQDLR